MMPSRPILVFGSVALDSVETPSGSYEEALGGSAVYFSMVAGLFTSVRLVSAAGEDFPQAHRGLLTGRADLSGLCILPGPTFRWRARYGADLDRCEVLSECRDVFEGRPPVLSAAQRACPAVFLSYGDPAMCLGVLDQVRAPGLAAWDAMRLRSDAERLLSRLQVLFVREDEALAYTGEDRGEDAARRLAEQGPGTVVLKRGPRGVLMLSRGRSLCMPALPGPVADPSGAGDCLAGGFLGLLCAGKDSSERALAVGVAAASLCVSGMGTEALEPLTRDALEERAAQRAALR